MSFSLDLNSCRRDALRNVPRGVGVDPRDLAKAAVNDLLSTKVDDDFDRAAKRSLGEKPRTVSAAHLTNSPIRRAAQAWQPA